jgi:heptosyltransferase-1
MPDILFIKTSSLGDIIHHMPAVVDARRACPDAHIAWVVEELYAPLVALHPAVDEVIAVASRRWRRALFRPETWREIAAFRRRLRMRAYDAVIDTQGLLRTGLITRAACGQRHGYDTASIRERAAAAFYDVRHSVGRAQHAIARNRILTGLALGYEPQGALDFGLGQLRPATSPPRAAVLLHATARPEKQWPVDRWQAVARELARQGFGLILPSGNAAELARSREIAMDLAGVELLHQQPLDRVAQSIAGAATVVGVDTGLLHLAAALSVPLVAIFVGASDPRLTGPLGAGPIQVLGKGVAPTVPEVQAAVEKIMLPVR